MEMVVWYVRDCMKCMCVGRGGTKYGKAWCDRPVGF